MYGVARSLFIFSFSLIMFSCKEEKPPLFTALDPGKTGVNFNNTLFEGEQLNVLNYIYFYNGGGVAAGDINNDGLIDLFFTGNMVRNRLYLNKGDFRFEDITAKAGVAEKQGWCTGTSMIDINGDGKLDIYICRSADGLSTRRKNLLFINNGDLSFTEKAAEYGLDDAGYSTQASFFDYDKDGDLDMFLINHSLHQYTTGAIENPALRLEKNPDYACKLFRNDMNESLHHAVFTDVSEQAGITSNVLTFGLGIGISDVNNDGWPDVYVSNDFNEPDYLFMNNGNGSFTEKLKECMDLVSLYSMGSDIADYNNDGKPDIVTLDMLPEENKVQKMHSGAENFEKFQLLFSKGLYYQYSRNMLQKNNGDGSFSEIGQLAGISNTDWSWSALLSDFDNDGNKDLMVTNGYVKDYTDMDFIKYSVDRAVRGSSNKSQAEEKEFISKMPTNVLTSYIFRNNGDGRFSKKNEDWGIVQKSVAAGAVYADLDNDGALDLVVNNTNEQASIYKNNALQLNKGNSNYLKIKLEYVAGNPSGIGTKLKVFANGQVYFQEQEPVRGFQSSVDPVLNFGTGKSTVVDSILIIWPDNKYQKLKNVGCNKTIAISAKDATGDWNYQSENTGVHPLFTPADNITYTHVENRFNDFSKQGLLINYLSRSGPCMAKADVNGDGLEDLFIGGAKGSAGQVFLQNKAGKFDQKDQPPISADLMSEDVAALFFDADGDNDFDLYVGSGGYEFEETDAALQDRLYLNDGKGNFSKSQGSLPVMLTSTSTVKAADLDGDKDLDLFVGGRVIPGKYPVAPSSYILVNDGHGKFSDQTKAIAPAIEHIGMITAATWLDLDNNGSNDLILAGEWMPLKVFLNEKGKLADHSVEYIKFPSSGWWSSILAEDMDGDGDKDLVIGNLGLNAQFKTNEKEPLSLYYKDFDGNGSIDPLFCYYINGISYPMNSRDDLTEQLPVLRKKFIEYSAYANATITDVFSPDQLKDAGLLQAQLLETVYLENKGKDGFVKHALPLEAQYAPVYSILPMDVNKDGKMDLLLSGNNSWTRIKLGNYSANHGVLLVGNGKGEFTYLPQFQSGLNLKGNVRDAIKIDINGHENLFFGINESKIQSLRSQ
jgi:hypothetical protein